MYEDINQYEEEDWNKYHNIQTQNTDKNNNNQNIEQFKFNNSIQNQIKQNIPYENNINLSKISNPNAIQLKNQNEKNFQINDYSNEIDISNKNQNDIHNFNNSQNVNENQNSIINYQNSNKKIIVINNSMKEKEKENQNNLDDKCYQNPSLSEINYQNTELNWARKSEKSKNPNQNIDYYNKQINSSNNLNENKFNDIQSKEKTNFNQINLNNNENIINELKENEILYAKENGYILIGKTGVGKTSLLNILYGKDIGKVGYSSKSETSFSNYYCIKEKIGEEYHYFCLVDTPGLYDTNGAEADKNQKQEIMRLVSENNIKVKGLLFLSNFQNERFDASEQNTLIEYNAIFPLKEFWERIIFIFTHYYGDPDGDSKEEIKSRSSKVLGEIIKNIMKKVKDISKTIDFQSINRKYYNIYSRIKNNKQERANLKIREDLINEILKYNKYEPMFTKLEIFRFEKYEMKENDNFVYDCDYYVYLDANNKAIRDDFYIIKKYPKEKDFIKEKKVKLKIEDCQINEKGQLVRKTTKKEGLEKIFEKYKLQIGSGVTIASVVGLVCTGIFCLPALPACLLSLLGGTYLIKKKYDDDKEREKTIDKMMKNQNIIDDINEKYLNNP